MWERIIYPAQIEAIQENTLLLQYPLTLQIPDTLRNNNVGNIYVVQSVEIGRYIVNLLNPITPQELLEAVHPTQVRVDELLRSRWFVQIA